MHTIRHYLGGLPRVFGVLLVALLSAAWGIGPPPSFLDDPASVVRAIEAITAPLAKPVRVLAIKVEPHEVSVEAQDPGDPRHIERYRLLRFHVRRLFHREPLKGPEPVQLNLINTDLEANLFDLSELDLSRIPSLMREAVERAALEDPARVTSIEVRRELVLLPKPRSGEVVYEVHVGSERERASIFADAAGRIRALDLAGTNRAREFSIWKEPARVGEAARAFADAIGSGKLLTSIAIGAHGKWVSFETNAEAPPLLGPGGPAQVKSYTWDLSGLKAAPTGGALDMSRFFGPKEAFALSDADFLIVGDLIVRARRELGMPQGEVTNLELSIETDRANPSLGWRMTMSDDGKVEGTVRFSAKGELLQSVLPRSRRPAFDGRDAMRWPERLEQIVREIGRENRITSITLDTDKITLLAANPSKPSELAQFILNEEGLVRLGTPSPFAAEIKSFTAADLAGLTADQLRMLGAKAAERLKLPVAQITSISIGRGGLDPSPAGNVSVEIRAEERPFGRAGRVNFEIDGREIKAYLP